MPRERKRYSLRSECKQSYRSVQQLDKVDQSNSNCKSNLKSSREITREFIVLIILLRRRLNGQE